MRNSDLLDILKSDYKDQYDFLIKKLNEKNSRGEKCFFLGFRDGYLNLYYKGMSVAKIELKDGKVQYTMSSYYLEGIDVDSPLDFEVFKSVDVFAHIISQIEKHVTGQHGEKGKNLREKVCQQWLANMNNSYSTDWYFIDMEYIYDQEPYGRPDLIAVSRKANENGKHDVALIELKIRHSQYTGLATKDYEDNRAKYDVLKNNLYDKRKDVRELKYGSGIVSHLADYLRFLYNEDNYKIQMRDEVLGMIQANVSIGNIDANDDLASVSSVTQLEDKPIIYVLTYSYTPYHPGDKEKKAEMKSMKQSLYNVLFGKRTPFGLKQMLNGEQISGLLSGEDEYKKAIKDDSMRRITRIQNVNGIDYKFIFLFKDPDDVTSKPWDCL